VFGKEICEGNAQYFGRETSQREDYEKENEKTTQKDNKRSNHVELLRNTGRSTMKK
jgi:hypothetical protein